MVKWAGGSFYFSIALLKCVHYCVSLSLLCSCCYKHTRPRFLDKELCFRGIYATGNYWVTPFLQHFAIIFYLRFTVLCFLLFFPFSGCLWQHLGWQNYNEPGVKCEWPMQHTVIYWPCSVFEHMLIVVMPYSFIQYCACHKNRNSIIQKINTKREKEKCWLLECIIPLDWNGCIGDKTQKPYRNGQTIMIIFKWKWSTVDVWLYGEKIRISFVWIDLCVFFWGLIIQTKQKKRNRYS